MRAYDFLGNIAIVNFPERMGFPEKKKIALKLLKENKSVETVLEKFGKVQGRLRKPILKYVAGEKTKEVLYRENNCVFRFNVDTTYFSPRLSNERKEIASEIKPTDVVFVMFAGVAPFSIVIAKNSKTKKVYSNEINREANKYGMLNAKLNKVQDRVEFVNGDIKRIVRKIVAVSKSRSEPVPARPQTPSAFAKVSSRDFSKIPSAFDVIVMPRPQLKDSFLNEAFMLSKKGTRIYYYDFCKIEDIEKIKEKVKQEASRARKNIKILRVKKAGEIAPYKVRVRVDFKVMG